MKKHQSPDHHFKRTDSDNTNQLVRPDFPAARASEVAGTVRKLLDGTTKMFISEMTCPFKGHEDCGPEGRYRLLEYEILNTCRWKETLTPQHKARMDKQREQTGFPFPGWWDWQDDDYCQ